MNNQLNLLQDKDGGTVQKNTNADFNSSKTKGYLDALSKVSPQNSGGTSQEQTGDKYTNLETTSYKELLNSKIQASAARDQAYKYSVNALNANGYGSQGLSESATTGIYNRYQSALDSANQNYQSAILDIEAQRAADAETKQESNWQNVMTMLQQAQNKEDVQYLKDNFYSTFSDEQKKMFDYYYNTYNKELSSETTDEWLKNNTTDTNPYTTYDQMVQNDVRTENTDYTIKDVEKEAKLLFSTYTANRTNGDVVRLEHEGGGSTNGIYLIYNNGAWYKTTKAIYDSANNTAFIKGGKFKSGTGTFTQR